MFKKIICVSIMLLCGTNMFSQTNSRAQNVPQKQVILFVWDGLRPDSVTKENTPNLYALLQKGVDFKDNHSSFPTFTMMNASSFATGDFAGKTGFFGNTLWDLPSLKSRIKSSICLHHSVQYHYHFSHYRN